jgi:hypothetical protein
MSLAIDLADCFDHKGGFLMDGFSSQSEGKCTLALPSGGKLGSGGGFVAPSWKFNPWN